MTKQRSARRHYPHEPKRDAVELVDKQGYTQDAAARSLGIRPNLIGRWRRELAEENGQFATKVDDLGELKRVRLENQQQREEQKVQ